MAWVVLWRLRCSPAPPYVQPCGKRHLRHYRRCPDGRDAGWAMDTQWRSLCGCGWCKLVIGSGDVVAGSEGSGMSGPAAQGITVTAQQAAVLEDGEPAGGAAGEDHPCGRGREAAYGRMACGGGHARDKPTVASAAGGTVGSGSGGWGSGRGGGDRGHLGGRVTFGETCHLQSGAGLPDPGTRLRTP